MKNYIFKYSILAMTATLGLVSCEDRELVTIENGSAPIVMDLSTKNLVLNPSLPSNPALTVSWEAATYTIPVETKYDIEISATEGFEAPSSLATTAQSQTYASFTTKEINEGVKKIGLVPLVAQKVYFRVKSNVGTNDLVQTSNVTSVMITPYLASPTYTYTDLYLVGDATAGAWDNAATNTSMYPLMKTSESSKYTYTGFFKTGGFKLVRDKGQWDPQWGLGGAPGVLSQDGGSGNIPVTADGYYKLTVDNSALTYTFVAVTAPTTTYAEISIIGTSTDGADIELTKSTFDPHVWTANAVTLKGGNFKFRANKDWAVNWGTNSEFFGTTTNNGADIPLTSEWQYNIVFNDSTGDYSLIPVK